MIRLISVAMAIWVLAAPGSASAATLLNFTITGGGKTLSARLPDAPTPFQVFGQSGWRLRDLAGIYDGQQTQFRNVTFYAASSGGGVDVTRDGLFLFSLQGPALFEGPTTAPTLKRGTFAFGTTSVTIAPVPEPSTWTLMILGVGAAGATLRRARVQKANAAA